MCRAAEITKQGISVLVGNSSNHAESVNKVWKRKSHYSGKPVQKQSKPCKYCAKFHELKQEKCPAYGKKCQSCGIQSAKPLALFLLLLVLGKSNLQRMRLVTINDSFDHKIDGLMSFSR